jgi:hypothetical protein
MSATLQSGLYHIKFDTTGGTDLNFIVKLDITKIPNIGSIDAKNRCTALIFSLKSYYSVTPTSGHWLYFYLTDSNGNKIGYKAVKGESLGLDQAWSFGDEKQFNLPIGEGINY